MTLPLRCYVLLIVAGVVSAKSGLHTRQYEVCGVGREENSTLCVSSGGDASTATTSMLYQHLGHSGLVVSRLSYGAWISFGLQVDVEEAYKIMKYCIDVGINFFDNAEAYANGKAEIIMGQALQKIWALQVFLRF